MTAPRPSPLTLCVSFAFALITGAVGGVRADGPAGVSGPVTVSLVRTGPGWQLLRDGKPYFIRGAGIAGSSLEQLARSARTRSAPGGRRDSTGCSTRPIAGD